MIIEAVLERIVPLAHYNEYEGQIDIMYKGRLLSCRTILPSAAWDRHRPGERRRANLWLERSGPVSLVCQQAIPMLKERCDSVYEATGKLRVMDGERILLDTIFPLDVDLDQSAAMHSAIPALKLGDYISVVGTMRLDLEPDLDE